MELKPTVLEMDFALDIVPIIGVSLLCVAPLSIVQEL
jgi:hypothetical protein